MNQVVHLGHAALPRAEPRGVQFQISGAAGAHQPGLTLRFQRAGAAVQQGLGLFLGLGDDGLGATGGFGADALDFALRLLFEKLVEGHD